MWKKAVEEAKAKRKPTAANRAYSRAFKKLAPKFKLKNGSWKKNGFANCCKASHKMCRKWNAHIVQRSLNLNLLGWSTWRKFTLNSRTTRTHFVFRSRFRIATLAISAVLPLIVPLFCWNQYSSSSQGSGHSHCNSLLQCQPHNLQSEHRG